MNTGGHHTETYWVTILKAGDAQAFDALFQVYGKRLYHFALGYLKSRQEAEEIVQEVFLKIWHNRRGLHPELSFRSYLFTIAYRQIMEALKKRLRDQSYVHEVAGTVVSFTEEMADRMNYQSLLDLVKARIEKLPPRQKEVLQLRKMSGLPVGEIAELLEISPKTVEHHLTEAIKNIKAGLDQESIAGLLFLVLFVREG